MKLNDSRDGRRVDCLGSTQNRKSLQFLVGSVAQDPPQIHFSILPWSAGRQDR